MLVGRAQPDHPTFSARPRAPPVVAAAAAVHMEMAVAPDSWEALSKLSRHLLCSCLVGTHDRAVGPSTRPQMLGRGALDVSDHWQHVCRISVCVCNPVEAWDDACPHVSHVVDRVYCRYCHVTGTEPIEIQQVDCQHTTTHAWRQMRQGQAGSWG